MSAMPYYRATHPMLYRIDATFARACQNNTEIIISAMFLKIPYVHIAAFRALHDLADYYLRHILPHGSQHNLRIFHTLFPHMNRRERHLAENIVDVTRRVASLVVATRLLHVCGIQLTSFSLFTIIFTRPLFAAMGRGLFT